jgi:hypothetical protein
MSHGMKSRCVRILQVLCPTRHCIVATAYESPDGEPNPEFMEQAQAAVAALIETNQINPWCGICHSRDWRYEDERTKFQTMDEAQPHLEELGRRQEATREYFRMGRN